MISILKEDGSPSLNVDEVRKVLGEKLLFEQKREKIFIDEREKDEVLKEIQDSFLSSSLSYLSHSDFPKRYILKKFNEEVKKESRYKDIPPNSLQPIHLIIIPDCAIVRSILTDRFYSAVYRS